MPVDCGRPQLNPIGPDAQLAARSDQCGEVAVDATLRRGGDARDNVRVHLTHQLLKSAGGRIGIETQEQTTTKLPTQKQKRSYCRRYSRNRGNYLVFRRTREEKSLNIR